jgi:benzoylformate decarboxylase
MFGNPGSTELPMLADFPDDFRYVLGLQEAVVVGMADGYAQASGTVGHANLHTAPGVGNAMGALFNAQANHSPLLVTAGQQVRAHMTMQANLTNRDATRVVHPYVKWSYEPPRAADVPAALGRAIHTAALAPKGPAFVSVPMDDWGEEAASPGTEHALARSVDGRAAPAPDAIAALAARIANASNPVLVAGPDIDASGGWESAVALAESQHLPVWSIPATGGGRIGFPEGHPQFQGALPPGIAPIAETLAGHDLILVVGASVFAYYPYLPGDLLAEGSELVQITADPDEAARAPMGEAIVADPAIALGALSGALTEHSAREMPAERDGPMEPPPVEEGGAISGTEAMAAPGAALTDPGQVGQEAPKANLAQPHTQRLTRPRSYK